MFEHLWQRKSGDEQGWFFGGCIFYSACIRGIRTRTYVSISGSETCLHKFLALHPANVLKATPSIKALFAKTTTRIVQIARHSKKKEIRGVVNLFWEKALKKLAQLVQLSI
jgi:hypothetical protein